MKRGHIRIGKGFGKDGQEKILAAAGVTNTYIGQIDAAIRSVRKGEVLYCVGLRGLAGSKDGIKAALKALHGKGAAAVDAATGRRSDGPCGADLALEAAVELSNERQGGARFSRLHGRKGGEAAAKTKAGRRTPTDKAQRIWLDKSISTNDEALAKINSFGYSHDWSERAAYNQFGSPGRPAGRRSQD